jgi:hypothetical protein
MIMAIFAMIFQTTGCVSDPSTLVSAEETTGSNELNKTSDEEESTEVDKETTGNSDQSIYKSDMPADYDTVFNQSDVISFHITIDSDEWLAMQEDLAGSTSTQKAGNKQENNREEAKPREGQISENSNGPAEAKEPAAANGPAEAKEPATAKEAIVTKASDESSEPIWVEASVTVNDITWDHVGIRYKGNSSLKSASSSGNNKLSFKLDFDEFEDEYPDTDNQRFYGFKQLNLNNNFSDSSLMHEKVAADLFNEFGVPASRTRFAIVYVDYGEGSQYYGVYTLVEEMDDTGILAQFTDDSGNLYKPENQGATFADGSYSDADMNKKNNEDEADYTDTKALYEIINSDTRVSDSTAWKSDLESVFNVDGFIKWLAANTVIQNWDTYGNMNHNFYLYNNPASGQLNWVPWDNNEAFSSGKGNNGALSISLSEVDQRWPIIRNIMDDAEYKAMYDAYLKEFVDEVFTLDKMIETYDKYYDLIKEYAYSEVSGYSFLKSSADFDKAVEALKTHVVSRNAAVEEYLAE